MIVVAQDRHQHKAAAAASGLSGVVTLLLFLLCRRRFLQQDGFCNPGLPSQLVTILQVLNEPRQSLQLTLPPSFTPLKLAKYWEKKEEKTMKQRGKTRKKVFSQKVHVVLFLSFVAAWLDLLIWSRMRNSLITDRSLLRFPTFRMFIFFNFKMFTESFFHLSFLAFFLHFQICCREKLRFFRKWLRTLTLAGDRKLEIREKEKREVFALL